MNLFPFSSNIILAMWRENAPRKQTDHPHFDSPCHVEKMVHHLSHSEENILPFCRESFLERKSFDKTFFFPLFSSLFHTIAFLQHTFSLHHMRITRMTRSCDFWRQEMLFFELREIIRLLNVEWRRDIRRDRTETKRRVKEVLLSLLHLGFCFLNYFSLPPRNSNSNIIRIISLLNKQKERDILLCPVDGF